MTHHSVIAALELAKLAHNPVGNLIGVPLQNNTNFNAGPLNGTQNTLNIQPVIPIEVNRDWNLITRTIVPLIRQPEFLPGQGSRFGLGDMQLSTFLSPSQPGAGGLIWGAGAIVRMPTSTEQLGNENCGLGPTAVVLRPQQGSPWVCGVLVNDIWSLSGSGRGGSYSNFLIQPFPNDNFAGVTHLTSSPIVTADWKADGSQRWTVPPGIGHIFHPGRLPANTRLGGYCKQRRSSGQRIELAAAPAGASDFPQVTRPALRRERLA
jgi:hypothetical protein